MTGWADEAFGEAWATAHDTVMAELAMESGAAVDRLDGLLAVVVVHDGLLTVVSAVRHRLRPRHLSSRSPTPPVNETRASRDDRCRDPEVSPGHVPPGTST